jgi:hypothetical protein
MTGRRLAFFDFSIHWSRGNSLLLALSGGHGISAGVQSRSKVKVCSRGLDSRVQDISDPAIDPQQVCMPPKKWRKIKRGVALSTLRSPRVLAKSAESLDLRKCYETIAYINRTKSAKSGGLERTRPRERISSSDRLTTVRRFAREARGYWASMRARNLRRMLVAEGLAEGVGFEPTIRFPVYTLSKRAPSATRPPLR